jgi:hypothetical protein
MHILLTALALIVPSDDSLTEDAVRRTAIERGVEIILEMQEGPDDREWPYQGVYRVKGQIPIGYRVGGTGISGMALLEAPGGGDERKQALWKATEFVTESINHPLMACKFQATYDVRGWGYTYGLLFLLELKNHDAVPEDLAEAVEGAIAYYLDGIRLTEIPEGGGWNYARRGGFDQPGPASPFMTGPTLQALFEAKKLGYEIDEGLVERGLDTLAVSRTKAGSFVYAGEARRRRDGIPGAVGRMLVGESTLYMAGRSELSDVRGAVDAFFLHWEWLEKRRAKDGTHLPPYGVAPYYFYFAHYYAAQAIELLPRSERDEYRRLLHNVLTKTRADDGSWNDRVFDRSANYGTAMSVMSLLMPEIELPAKWEAP